MNYSPDGRRLAFVANFLADKYFYVWDGDSLRSKRLDIIEGDFIFSPDGRKVFFVADYPYWKYNDWLTRIKTSIHNMVLLELKYLLFRRLMGVYDNKYLCVMDTETWDVRKIRKLPISSGIGKVFIHWDR